MTTPPHLSASAISLYMRCPEAFRLKYVELVDEPPSADRSFGSAMHAAIARWHDGRTETLPQLFCEAWEEHVDRDLAALDIAPAYFSHGAALASLYERRRGIRSEPMEVERRFWFMAREHGVTVPLIGYWDVRWPDGFDEIKTSAWPWREDRVQSEYQAHLYAAAFRSLEHRLPRRVLYWLLSRQPKPALRIESYEPSDELCDFALSDAARVERLIRADDYAGKCNGGADCPCKVTAEERAALSFAREG